MKKRKLISILIIALIVFVFPILGGCADNKDQVTNERDSVSAEGMVPTEVADPESEATLSDGSYELELTMSGGSGKAYIKSPVSVDVRDGIATAKLVWSSKNYDYMIVGGTKYNNENEGGDSVFTVSLGDVADIFEPIKVIGDTVAMSTPHEIEYTITLTLRGDSMQSQSAYKNNSNITADIAEYESWEEIPNRYASNFSIRKKDDRTFLTIGTDDSNMQYILLVSSDDEAVKKDGITLLCKPLQNTYLVSTSAMDLICKINLADRIRLSGTKQNDWFIPEAVSAMENGQLLYAGKYNTPDYELILSEKCSLAIENTMIYHNPETKEKLEELGVPVIVELSSYEKHPLGRLEWIRFYGYLFGAEKEADAYFEEQVCKIEQICQSAGSSDVAQAPDKLTIAFFSINTSGLVTVRKSGDYITQMINLTGGQYVPETQSTDESSLSTMNLSLEEFYANAQDADILIYNSAIESELVYMDELISKSSLFNDFRAVKNKKVYCTGKNFFQQTTGMAEFMEDIKNVMEGNEENLHYLQKLQ